MLGKRWLSVLVVASLATFGLGMSALADTASEAGFLAEINASRAANGLAPLGVDGGLRAYARVHTQDMIDAGEIYHSSGAELKAAAGSGWTTIGENVGRGGIVSSLHDAFMNSPGHRANILKEVYNWVGIGTDTSEGMLYVTVVFMAKGSSTTTTTSPAATTSTTKSPTPTTPTTPTTTLIVGPDKAVTPGVSCVDATRLWWTCHN